MQQIAVLITGNQATEFLRQNWLSVGLLKAKNEDIKLSKSQKNFISAGFMSGILITQWC